MKPKKKLIDFLKEKYPNQKLGYDDEDGTVWTVHNGSAINWNIELEAWCRSCLTQAWFDDYCKKIK